MILIRFNPCIPRQGWKIREQSMQWKSWTSTHQRRSSRHRRERSGRIGRAASAGRRITWPTSPLVGSEAEPSTPFIAGLEPLSSAAAPLNAQALAFEHILASIARVEARLDAEGRQPASAPPRSRPDPDPPYDATAGWRRGAMDQRPVYTTTVTTSTQPLLGFAGPSTNQGPQRVEDTGTEHAMEELDVDTSAKIVQAPERTIGKDRPRRLRRPPDHLADFATSRK
ncbi:hypothetical protein SASPL_145209 [Salvia splendens]|uniref:Uncharacterized protein n=1 Tax=Salvia splendens TaxID=180675 RepID=A0A8X8WG54_SALSN|nr:hypothetical protein SASPL_145209 [Salvia splendens]